MRLAGFLSVAALLTVPVALGAQELIPINLNVEPLGKGEHGTVVSVTIGIEPEDRALVGRRIEIRTTLSSYGEVVEDLSTEAAVDGQGRATVHREWRPGKYDLRVLVTSLVRPAIGISDGKVKVPATGTAADVPIEPGPRVDLTPARSDALHFLPIPQLESLEAIHIEVAAPEGTAMVEFFQGSKSIARRRRPPWSIRVSTRKIVHRSRFRAVATDSLGRYLGEDVVVVNAPAGESGIEILVGPKQAITDGRLPITVAVTDQRLFLQATLQLDDTVVARWESCPCVVEVPVRELEDATILSAEVVESDGRRFVEVSDIWGGFRGSVEVDLVELQVQVFDAHDVPVIGLDPDAFSVFEDGREVSIEGFGTIADQALALVVAVDSSGSMTGCFPEVRQAVAAFAESLLLPGDQAALLRFASDTEVLVSWSYDPQDVGRGLDEVVPGGSTSLHDAIIHSLMKLHSLRGRKALVLLTDGRDTSSFASFADAKWFSRSMRVPLFIITLSNRDAYQIAQSQDIDEVRYRHRLATLAKKSGGRAFFYVRVGKLPDVYAEIAEVLRSQYVLWYRPESLEKPGKFRSIEVKVADPTLEVRTISGYYPGE